jgi:N-acetylglucosamine-6-phosphate deacetylase
VTRVLAGALLSAGDTRRGWVAIDGASFAEIGQASPPRGRVLRHDGFIAPGLVDLQVNGGAGVEVTGGDGALARVDGLLLRHGVTSYLPTVITTDETTADRTVQEIAARMRDPASPVAGAHLEGPYLNEAWRGVHRAELLRSPPARRPGVLAADAVRLVTLAPELPGALALVADLARAGVAPFLGHSAASPATAAKALRAGARGVTHLFNAMPPMHHRRPGLVGWALTEPRVAVSVIADGLHVSPRMLRLVRRAAGERVVLVSDASTAAGAPPARYQQAGREIERDGRGRVTSGDGELAGSSLTLDEAVRRWRRHTGASLAEAWLAASERPAALAGVEAGLRPGAPADLALLDRTGSVVRVMKAGEWVGAGAPRRKGGVTGRGRRTARRA